jgi:F-type H+-transporting ATPase subunit a
VGNHGLLGWLKHFAGPVWWLAPLMLPVEIISHLARVLSLALRLFGNIFGEHTAKGIFFALVPFIIPWPIMGLGIVGTTIQTFIFIMLTSVYLSEAAAQEH